MEVRIDTASRVIAASPRAVYAALVSEDARRTWLPPTGMTARFDRYDARPGGGYRMVLVYTDASEAPGKSTASEDVVEATFVELVPDTRVVEAIEFSSDDPRFAGTMTMTWSLTPDGTGTRVTIEARDVPTGITPEDHAAGMGSSLANLAAFLA